MNERGADAPRPSGEITFFFTDVEGSTGLWERDADAMGAALAEHDARLREVFAHRDGYIFTTAGDSFAVAFASPADAVAAAIDAQHCLLEPCQGVMLRVRMGIHTGTATARDDDYFGAVVNRCARLMSSAHGGQILLSGATAGLVGPTLPADVELVDFGEHRLKDLLRPEHIFQVRHPELDDRFPPVRTLEGPWSNLPTQLTSFVGRDRELTDVGELLAERRLVTLTGAGGSGKTRLSLQVAADAVEHFADGIRLVELGAVTDPQYVLDEVAAVIGASAVPDTPFADTIAISIGSQRMLLILDNCEHVLDSVADIVGLLLQRCDRLKVLATSRERLGTVGEVAYRVPSLAMPDGTDLRVARDSDSVRLFTERAILARPDFALTPDNVEAVVAICRRLDGIPLALELAAARLRMMSADQIASRLDERFRLLGGGSRGTLERHRTLAATIDWSYDHLSDAERALFRRMSIFPGTFSIEAVESVGAGDDVDRWDVLDLIAGLVDKSMLVPEDADDGDVRYRLLESMRHYGRQRLDEAGETAVVADAHVRYCVERCEQLQAMQRSRRLAATLVGLDQDDDNIRAALRHALDASLDVEAAQIVGAIGHAWYASGRFREGVEWCRELFTRDLHLPDEVLAAALHAYATLLGSWSQPDVGAEMLIREVELRRRIGDPARLAAALNNLGNVQNDMGDLERGEVTLREAVEQFRAADEPATLSLASLGYGHKDAGRYDVARPLFAEALDEATVAEDSYGIALARSGLGECAVHERRDREARPLLDEARSRFDELGVRPGVAYADVLLAITDIDEGLTPDAAQRLRRALDQPDAHWYEATKFWILQLVAGIIADPTVAAELIGAAHKYYDDHDQTQPLWVLRHLETTTGRIRAAIGDDDFDAATDRGRLRTTDEAIGTAEHALAQLPGSDGIG